MLKREAILTCARMILYVYIYIYVYVYVYVYVYIYTHAHVESYACMIPTNNHVAVRIFHSHRGDSGRFASGLQCLQCHETWLAGFSLRTSHGG